MARNTLAESLQHDSRRIDAQIGFDRLEDVTGIGRIRGAIPVPSGRGKRDEDGAAIGETPEPVVVP